MNYEYESDSISEEVYAEGETSSSDIIEQLEVIKKLKELLDLGAITQSEFDEKKRELLGTRKKKAVKQNLFVILIWASLGFTVFSYLINVIISLTVGGNLFWMFDYILYGYIAGFICMGVGIIGYVFSFLKLTRRKTGFKAKTVSLILMVALLCVTFSPLLLHDPLKYEQNINWAGIGQTTYSVTGCEYRRTNVKIPSKHKGSPVTSISFGAFSHHQKLEEVEIPDSITGIGGSAFAYCENLTVLVIPDSVTYVGENAFMGCNSLVIFCEAESMPEGWNTDWNCRFNYYGDETVKQDWEYVTVYWADEWEYDRHGDPVTIQ